MLYRIPPDSISMTPTLQPGDLLLTAFWRFWWHAPQRGEIVIVRRPDYPRRWRGVKRIIALPGDTIAFTLTLVLLNGRPLIESYLAGTPFYQTTAPVTLAANQYYVLGDSRNCSQDSRVWQPPGILRTHLRGPVTWFFRGGRWQRCPTCNFTPAPVCSPAT